MADFQQARSITTLHRLGEPDLEWLEGQLQDYSRRRPVALVLPCLFSELEGEAIHGIVAELRRIPYISHIVLSMDRMNADQFQMAARFFSQLPQEHRILWHDGPRMRGLVAELEEAGLAVGEQGKGRGSWFAFGYVIGMGRARVIALHDCDILTYRRDLLARLCFPVMNPSMGYEFCKGYYARYRDQLYGRVTRLFVTPLLRALMVLTGGHPILDYLDSFRYPLAGEFAVSVDLAQNTRIPADWGLEIGMLTEVYRNVSMKRICQVDLAENYEHKHRPLSPRNPERGLMKMAIDIADSILRTLAGEGVQMGRAFFRTLSTLYERMAEDTIRSYNDDALINKLHFDRHAENQAVETFRRGLQIAGTNFLEDPHGSLLIPSWIRVTAAIPDFTERLVAAVEADYQEVRAAVSG
ncbi:MAG: cell wall biogenesis glycosyltransferase [Acidobacteriota bacterium]